MVQDQRISVTRRSHNLIREQRGYLWKTDRNGVIIPGVAEDGNDHALDAGRYAMEDLHIDSEPSPLEKYMMQQARMTSGNNYAK